MRVASRRILMLAASLALVGAMFAGTVGAANSSQRSTISVVAQGLAAPRGLIYDPVAHRVLVAEAGVGGPSQQHGGTCAQTSEEEGGALWCYGPTGSVLQYTERDGAA